MDETDRQMDGSKERVFTISLTKNFVCRAVIKAQTAYQFMKRFFNSHKSREH